MYNSGDVIGWNGAVYEVIKDNGNGTGSVKDITPDADTGMISNEILHEFEFNLGGTPSHLIAPAMNTLTETEYLRMFFQDCNFGPAHDDVIDIMNDNIMERTGKKLPFGYDNEYDE